MERTIDIKAAVEKAGLDYSSVAAELFPLNAYPRLALNRVAKREAFLDEMQISKLSNLTGLSVAQLFGEESWKSFYKGDGIFYFMNGDFKAELNTKDWKTKIFHKDSLFHDEIIHSEFIRLSEYVGELNELIKRINFKPFK